MNIKRRLYVSNVLMWLIPVAVSVAVFFGGQRVFAELAGLSERERVGRHYIEAMQAAGEIMDRWQRENAPADAMINEAESFNERYAENGQVILIYRDGEALNETPVKPDGDAITQVLGKAGDAAVFGRTTARTTAVGDYLALFYEDLRFVEMSRSYRGAMFNGMIAAFVCAGVMVLLTNFFLTRFVSRRILYAMDILTYGVHQIRDGNLDYRIEYGQSDEFAVVCDDFNQMAGTLLRARLTRERDEQSRRVLIAGISHDLRTPLTSIKAYVEGLEQGVASTADARKRYIDTIKNKTEDLEQIIEKLFLFSKLDTGEFPYRMERVELGAAVSEIASGVSAEYRERGLDISVSRNNAPVFVNVDAMQMRYVLINMFENSLKYKEKDTGHLTVSVAHDDGEAVLTISDDGPGVPGEALPKLFDLFYRIDGSRNNPSRGSGLGLAIAAKMVAHFGGKISARNQENGGLSIEVRLPEV
jgi:signal transduction histidine kinase